MNYLYGNLIVYFSFPSLHIGGQCCVEGSGAGYMGFWSGNLHGFIEFDHGTLHGY